MNLSPEAVYEHQLETIRFKLQALQTQIHMQDDWLAKLATRIADLERYERANRPE